MERQLKRSSSCDMKQLDNGTFLAMTSEGLLQVTSHTCECLFRKSTGLPCRHIFKCRSLMSLSLFDVNLCLSRWSRSYCEKIINDCEAIRPLAPLHDLVNNYDGNNEGGHRVKVLQAINQKPRYLSNHEKFNIMQKEGRKIAELCSEVSTDIFYKRLNIIQTIGMNWADHQDSVILKLFNNLTENSNQLLESQLIQSTTETELQIQTNENFIQNEEFRQTNTQNAINQIEINNNGAGNEDIIEEFLIGKDGELISISNCNGETTLESVTTISKKDDTFNQNKVATDKSMTDILFFQEHIITSDTNSSNSASKENNSFITSTKFHEVEVQNEKNRSTEEVNTICVSEFDSGMKEGLDVNITCNNLLNSTNISIESVEHQNNEKQDQIQETTSDINLQNIKMPSKIRKRGRPKGFGNTVIGLKKSRKKANT
ncbi:unnamed protein product [Brassicogethes aeneus]|uniref:SWIM-type domain-containing protein n=1 Tax=Brassicogethes aeneus TaxID=1431903 RepID=A0A9P0FDV4_BRAAE|nr:unnamed protein product [Brassicogethes aeneus]